MNKYQKIVDKLNSTNPKEVYKLLSSSDFNPSDIYRVASSNIILSKEVFKVLMDLLKECKNNDREYGCFIFGNEIDDNVVLFDKLPVTFFKSNIDSIDVTEENVRELLENIESGKYTSVAHVHTHPNLVGVIPKNYSDQDLYVYGYLQKFFQNDRKNISYIGGLLTTSNSDEEISFVFYDEDREQFYRFENIYVYDSKDNDGTLNKLGTNNTVHVLNSKKLKRVSIPNKENK